MLKPRRKRNPSDKPRKGRSDAGQVRVIKQIPDEFLSLRVVMDNPKERAIMREFLRDNRQVNNVRKVLIPWLFDYLVMKGRIDPNDPARDPQKSDP